METLKKIPHLLIYSWQYVTDLKVFILWQVTTEQLLSFFSQVGEVKYVRMAGDEKQPTKNAYVEFTDQRSISTALTYNGVMFQTLPIRYSRFFTNIGYCFWFKNMSSFIMIQNTHAISFYSKTQLQWMYLNKFSEIGFIPIILFYKWMINKTAIKN